MNTVILKSAADANFYGLSWRFIEDGEGYGIIGKDNEYLPVNYNDDGQPDGWEYEEEDD